MLHEGLVHAAAHAGVLSGLLRGTEVLFLISGGMTFAYMLKLFFCLLVKKNEDPIRQEAFDENRYSVSKLSGAVLNAGAILLIALGISQIAVSLVSVMTGTPLLSFDAFSLENLKGSLISLSIGAFIYVIPVRMILRDRDLWNPRLDLEDLVYRPLLLQTLPTLLGEVARWFGENVIVKPLCRVLFLFGSIFGRAMDTSTDALILLARKSVFREERVKDGSNLTGDNPLKTLGNATAEALSQVLDNFSYAMMMTCMGVIAVLVAIAIWIL